MKQRLSFLLAVIFTICSVLTPTAQAKDVQIDYVALGDSLAAGQTPYGNKVGTGYTDMISEELDKGQVLGSFTKDYATSGETSVELLDKLKRDDVQQVLKEAELVTISSGANDFFRFIKTGGSLASPAAMELLTTVGANVGSAIDNVKSASPEADIYVFGYYAPLVFLQDETTKAQFLYAFQIFNNNLKKIAEAKGIHFVEVASAFDVNSTAYLPNPTDVHPNEAGYQVIANQFFSYYTIPVNGTFPDPTGDWGKVMDKRETLVEANKKWTITLNKEINPTTLSEAIYVVKDGSQLINVEKNVPKDHKQIIVSAPKQGYKPGTYQLMITNNLTDTAGKPLNTTVIMSFIVK